MRMFKGALGIAAGALALAGCGATTPSAHMQHIAHAALGRIAGSAQAQARVARLLTEGRNRQAGTLIANTDAKRIEEAQVPTPMALEILLEPAVQALPPEARRAAESAERAAVPGLTRAELVAEHKAQLRAEASEAEESYPQAMRKPLLHACEQHQSAALCECAVRHLEAHLPFAQLAIEPRAAGRRLVGYVAKCELEQG